MMDVEKHNKHHQHRSLFDKEHAGYKSINDHTFRKNYILPDNKFTFENAAKHEFRNVFPIKDKTLGREFMCKIIRVDFKTREKDLLRHLIPMMVHHKNIIDIHDAFILKEDKIVDKKFVILIMELCHQNLEQFLLQLHQTGKWNENFQLRKNIMQQLLEVFSYLHERNIVHLGLRPEHVLINDKGIVKLIDFGQYNEFDEKGFDTIHTGSRIKHKIKHIFKRKVREEEVNSIFFYKRHDIYRLGVLLLVLDLYPKVKFSDDYLNFEDQKFDEKKILGLVEHDVKDPTLRQILPDMLQEKPKNRLNLTQILQGWRDTDTTKMGKVEQMYQEHILKKPGEQMPGQQGGFVEQPVQQQGINQPIQPGQQGINQPVHQQGFNQPQQPGHHI